MSNAYATTNLLSGLAASAFTWSAGLNDATRSRLNDGWMDARYVNGSPSTGLNVVIDFGGPVAPTLFAILNSNPSTQRADVAVKIESADDAAISVNASVRKAATAEALNNALFYNKDHVLQFVAGTARRYWRLTWSWGGGGAITNFAIGELYAAVQTTLTRRSIYGDGEAPNILTADLSFYNGGSNSYFLGGPIRQKRLVYSDLSTSDRNELLTMWNAVQGPAKPFLWIESYEATAVAAAVAEQEVVFGNLKLNQFAWTQPDFNLFDSPDLTVTSLGREIGS